MAHPSRNRHVLTHVRLVDHTRRDSLKKRSLERSKAQAQEYHKLLVQRLKEQRERR